MSTLSLLSDTELDIVAAGSVHQISLFNTAVGIQYAGTVNLVGFSGFVVQQGASQEQVVNAGNIKGFTIV